MRPIRMLAAGALFASASVAALSPPAAADPKPLVDAGGPGTYTVTAGGSAALAGTATGTPFDGPYTASLAAADGTLPEPGVCEAATVTARVDGPGSRFIELQSTDEVCGQHLQPPYVVTQVFTGRYTVTGSSSRRLVGTDGFVEVRLATEGRAHLFAIDT